MESIKQAPSRVVLLDRDGTVVVEPPSLDVKLNDFKLFPDTLAALQLLAEAGFSAIFISNQTGIAERDLTQAEYDATNDKILEVIRPTGLHVLKIYTCPHGPNDECVCRKPKPAMLLWAAKDFNFDLSEAYLIGDNVSDVEAGLAAGTKTILLKQGLKQAESNKATFNAVNLTEAVQYILSHQSATI